LHQLVVVSFSSLKHQDCHPSHKTNR
jgi:hypothetical protein